MLFATIAQRLGHNETISGSFKLYGLTLSSTEIIIFDIKTANDVIIIGNVQLTENQTVDLHSPIIINAGLKFVVTFGTTSALSATVYRSNIGA